MSEPTLTEQDGQPKPEVADQPLFEQVASGLATEYVNRYGENRSDFIKEYLDGFRGTLNFVVRRDQLVLKFTTDREEASFRRVFGELGDLDSIILRIAGHKFQAVSYEHLATIEVNNNGTGFRVVKKKDLEYPNQDARNISPE